MKKKLLSLAVAICMVATLLPSMVLTAGAETVDAEYKIIYEFGSNSGAIMYTDPQTSTYTQTKGLWTGMASSGNVGGYMWGNRARIDTTEANPWYALKIKVPVANTYVVSFIKYGANGGADYGVGNVYLIAADRYPSLTDENIASAISEANVVESDIDYSAGNGATAQETVYTDRPTLSLDAKEYIVIFKATGTNKTGYKQFVTALILSTLNASNTHTVLDGDKPVFTGTVSVNNPEILVGSNIETVSASIYKVADGYNKAKSYAHNKTLVEDKSIITFESSKPSVATVESDGTITAVGPGTTEITAKLTDGTYGSTIPATLTVTAPPAPEPDDEQLIADAFTTEDPVATQYNPSVSGAGYNASEGTATVVGITATLQTEGEYKNSYKMYAPEKNGDAQFLYWAKGLSINKKIVSYENEFYYTPAGGDNNILIAVYDEADGDVNKAEFYNANGQLIKLITNASDDKEVPALPSMAGYNSASSWKQYNGETEVTVGADIEPTGTMIFVAQYNRKKPIDVTVTVENGNGTATVPYGEPVTCTPDASKGTFKWWTKEVNGVSEIVSIDDTYSFLAWEDCTVTAEYADAKPAYTGNTMKIIIDTFTAGSEKAVMAEFIGFGADTVEKGIMIGTNKIAMTKPGDQFTVTGEPGNTFKGYAIVKDGETYKLIVDGEAKIDN